MPDRILNLTFHGIGDPPPGLASRSWDLWLTREEFAETLDAVSGRPEIRLTFDDSCRSDVEIVFPELKRRALVGTFFVVVGRLDKPDYVTAEEVRTLAQEGMVIGSHGWQHRPWRRLTTADVDEELVRSRAVLEDLTGTVVDEAACPFGVYDRRTVQGLRAAGYRHAFTSDGGWAHPTQWMQARNTLARGTGSDAARKLAAGELPEPPSLVQPLKNIVKRWR